MPSSADSDDDGIVATTAATATNGDKAVGVEDEGDQGKASRWAVSRQRRELLEAAATGLTPRSADGRRMPTYSDGCGDAVGGFKEPPEAAGFHCPAVVPLNVGGVCYITRRSTLLKDSESMLATMFSGRHEMQKDKHGYYFIDTNGAYFGYILDYLRHGKLPPNEAALPVYQEAGYFGLVGLQEALAVTPGVAREIVRLRHEEQFPDYPDLRRRLIGSAVDLAVATRSAELIVWPHRGQAAPLHASCVAETAHVKVGPWSGPADEETLMRTLHADLTEAGFCLSPLEKKRCKFFVSGQTCTRFAYKLGFKFT